MTDQRQNVEWVLSIGGAITSCPSLLELDFAFWRAVRATPVPTQITAETYGLLGNQGIGKSHAYRLVDGRVFRRPLATWDTSDMELIEQ